jgi:hypothetical protein
MYPLEILRRLDCQADGDIVLVRMVRYASFKAIETHKLDDDKQVRL